MNAPTIHRLPAALESAASRVKATARQAVERTIESLGLAALSATSVSQRSEILEAQFELDRKSAIFILAFDQAFEERLRRDTAPRDSGPSGGLSNWDQLSLVADREVEVKVAAERFGLQMSHACEWELRELNGYLGALLARERIEQDQNPLRPELIGLAMIRAADQVSEREDVRRIVVAECTRSLADALGPTYAAIVADFRAAGIQPTALSVRQTESPADPRRGPPAGGAVPRGGTPGGATTGGGGAETTSDFAGSPDSRSGAWSASRAAGLRHAAGTTLGQVDVGMMNVLRRLAAVGATLPSPLPSASATGGDHGAAGAAGQVAANLIRDHRDELRAASRGAVDHLVIDVIGSLFDQILSDPKVPPQIAHQIARLQLPVLRAALGDPSFFSSRRHPVRRFVNRIASIGSGVDDFDSESGRKLVARVRELVQQIVEGDFDQVDIYESKLAALEAFVAELARAEVATPAVDAAALLQRKEDELRLQAMYSQQLESELAKLAAPAFLGEFVAKVWSRVLLRAAQEGGVTGERTLRMRKAAGELLMSVQPKATPQARKQFLADLPKLMQALNEGLDLIAWPDDRRRSFFGLLLPAHAEALKNIAVRPLDYNLLARRVEAAMERPAPSPETLLATATVELPALPEEALLETFDAAEAAGVGLIKESAVDWSGKVDVDLSAEPEVTEVDIRIDGLANQPDAPEPSRGRSLADHVQLGFAYRMNMQGQWTKVRLAHVSPARTFFVFTYGDKQRRTVSMTHRMLVRMCESGRMAAYESAYLLERATARARKQLAELTKRRPG